LGRGWRPHSLPAVHGSELAVLIQVVNKSLSVDVITPDIIWVVRTILTSMVVVVIIIMLGG
jgi:hypothetical protein